MSYNSLHKYLIDNKLWVVVSMALLGWYLSPLFQETFYVPIFDNLDSNVVWYKILAESGKIFAPNDAIIPNMMNGLPRSSYPGEFNVILWLYYFFEPKTAFIINEILIHLIAFFSMFLFLKKYIVKQNSYYNDVPIYIGALYFALLPFWSGAGASIPLLPLVTYTLLNIKNQRASWGNWLFLMILPLYSSFIFLYMFYIILAGTYLAYDTIKNKKLNYPLFYALFLMGSMFLLSEYRLVYNMFFDTGFVSHRTEFDIFFKEDLWETYRLSLVNFLIGHVPHAQSFQGLYLIPIALSAVLLTFIKRRLSSGESLTVWLLLSLSFIIDIWKVLLIHKFTLPFIAFFSSFSAYFRSRYRLLPLLILFVIILSFYGAMFEFKGLHFITETFPIFKALNMIRMIFIEPFVYTVILVLAFVVFLRKVKYALLFGTLFIFIQFTYSYTHSFYQISPKEGYASFEDYYAPLTFKKLKQKMHWQKNDTFVSYGIEPAVALYNDVYTLDGYSTNYPLAYKYVFKKVFSSYRYNNLLFDKWGSKVYISTVPNLPKWYHKGLVIKQLRFDIKPLCKLHIDYILSPYRFEDPAFRQKLHLESMVKGEISSWDLYSYKVDCH